MKLLFFTLLFVSLLLSSSFLADATVAPAPAPVAGSCNAMCSARCAKAGIPKRCFKYCCVCCDKCKCVPSGTYGNKSECPCYRDMLNSKGTPKCP
ncbi:UNVERIFIED_CONTAM: Peamaclein [Sesamum radiatum]|uniref:Peamaclein n=1 Tax=Sesamum radiatum TaxID=300843 RepID=A0AAW2VQF1_SESRA